MEPEKGPLEKEQYLHTTDFGVPALSLLGYGMNMNSSVSFYGGSVRRRCFFPARTNNDLLRITGKLWPSDLHSVYT